MTEFNPQINVSIKFSAKMIITIFVILTILLFRYFWENILSFFIWSVANLVLNFSIFCYFLYSIIKNGKEGFDLISKFRNFELEEILIFYKIYFKDAAFIGYYFEPENESDFFELTDESNKGIKNYLAYLNHSGILHLGRIQTKNIANYLKTHLSPSYKVLWYFMRINFDYTKKKGLGRSVTLPNAFWAKKSGNADDYLIFMSSVLINWGVSHHLVYDEYENSINVYIRTVGNTIIDPIVPKFGESDVPKNQKFINQYSEFVDAANYVN